MKREAIPSTVLIYGVLGLIPFLAPPVIALTQPRWAGAALLLQAIYAALILSFLGGARWAFGVGSPAPNPVTITLSMLPTIAGLAILTLPAHARGLQLWILAIALTLHWVWDLRAQAAPPWFARLRTLLTLCAVAGLLGGAWVFG